MDELAVYLKEVFCIELLSAILSNPRDRERHGSPDTSGAEKGGACVPVRGLYREAGFSRESECGIGSSKGLRMAGTVPADAD